MTESPSHIDTWWNGERTWSALQCRLSFLLCVLVIAASVFHGVAAQASQVLPPGFQAISHDNSDNGAPSGADFQVDPGCRSGAVCSLLAIAPEGAATWEANERLATRGGDPSILGSRDVTPLFRPPKLSNQI